MELYLHAQDGKQTVEVDNLGRTMNVIEQIDPVAGKDVYLTLDLELQKRSEELLEKQLAHLISQKLVMKNLHTVKHVCLNCGKYTTHYLKIKRSNWIHYYLLMNRLPLHLHRLF